MAPLGLVSTAARALVAAFLISTRRRGNAPSEAQRAGMREPEGKLAACGVPAAQAVELGIEIEL